MNSYRVALQGYSDAVSKMDELTGDELAVARANAKAARLTSSKMVTEKPDYPHFR